VTKAGGHRVIIIGAGPGGLAAAIALRQAGLAPVVFERASQMREVGSGLTLWPNAMNALERLGLKKAVESISLPTTGIAMRSWRGGLLFDVPSSITFENRFGVSGAALHRTELVAALVEALGEGGIKLGARCVGFAQDEAGVVAHFEDGSEISGDLLIGADGIESGIRAQLFGKPKLRFAGYTVWRGVTRFDLEVDVGVTSMGRGAQFGYFPMTGGRVYWFASAAAREGGKDWPVGRKREIIERFGDWHKPIRSIVEATGEAAILRTDIFDLKPLKRWSIGRVSLLGDAAHPSAPTLGQGACQAIEDGVVLASCLGGASDVPFALKAYESRRIPRTSAITIQSRRMGRMGCWKNPVGCWLRDRLIKAMPERTRLQQLSGIFRFEI
jgi:2-polyprenyl-6-methoxyphenol hydroxylase-like FAD-dependent oxidoreductase